MSMLLVYNIIFPSAISAVYIETVAENQTLEPDGRQIETQEFYLHHNLLHRCIFSGICFTYQVFNHLSTNGEVTNSHWQPPKITS